MRILFMGTPEFARVSLKYIIEAGFEVIGVVSQPDRPKGRGMELQSSEVKLLALEHQLPVWQPEKVDTTEFVDLFQKLKPDLVVVVAFGQKIPSKILFGAKYGCINVHGSLLPKYRGAAPIQCCLLNGDCRTGITTMYMDEGWDTGDIIYQESLEIHPNENFGTLYTRLAELGGELLVKTIKDIEKGVAPRIKQNNEFACLAPKIKPELQQIDWNQSAQMIHNLIRTCNPVPGAETFFSQERLKILETRLLDELPISDIQNNPGTILQVIKKQGIVIATGDSALLITKVQPAGKKPMSALDYANGRSLKSGMVFGK